MALYFHLNKTQFTAVICIVNLAWIFSCIGYTLYTASSLCILVFNIIHYSTQDTVTHAHGELLPRKSVNYQIQMLNWRILINKILTIQVLKVEFKQTHDSLQTIKQFVDADDNSTQSTQNKSTRRLRSCSV